MLIYYWAAGLPQSFTANEIGITNIKQINFTHKTFLPCLGPCSPTTKQRTAEHWWSTEQRSVVGNRCSIQY